MALRFFSLMPMSICGAAAEGGVRAMMGLLGALIKVYTARSVHELRPEQEPMSESLITVTLPDGSARTYPAGTTGSAVAASIGAGLAKAALAIRLDGQIKDLKTPIRQDAQLEIVTLKDKNEAELL